MSDETEWVLEELIEMYRLQAKYFNCGHLRALNSYQWVDKKHPQRKPRTYCKACNYDLKADKYRRNNEESSSR